MVVDLVKDDAKELATICRNLQTFRNAWIDMGRTMGLSGGSYNFSVIAYSGCPPGGPMRLSFDVAVLGLPPNQAMHLARKTARLRTYHLRSADANEAQVGWPQHFNCKVVGTITARIAEDGQQSWIYTAHVHERSHSLIVEQRSGGCGGCASCLGRVHELPLSFCFPGTQSGTDRFCRTLLREVVRVAICNQLAQAGKRCLVLACSVHG